MAKKEREIDLTPRYIEIERLETLLAKPIEEIPRRNRAGHEILRQNAIAELAAHKTAIEVALIPARLVGVFAFGPRAVIDGVAKTLAVGGLSIEADEVYRTIAEQVEPTLGADRRWTVLQWGHATRAVGEIASGLNYEDMMPLPTEHDHGTLPTSEDLVAFLRQTVVSSTVADLQYRYIRRALVREAIAGALAAPKIPVLVTSVVPEEISGLRRLFARSATHEFAPDFDTSDRDAVANIFKSAT
jgi:hypothetical protein